MAHHPVAYMAAILTSVKDDKDRKPYYLYACRSMGIEVLPPDVNDSGLDFAPATGGGRAIRYGLSAVRNVGEAAVQQILKARGSGGPFASFADFCRRVDPAVLTKRVLESLIRAGAFQSIGYPRRALLEEYDKVSGPISSDRRAEAAGQDSLFSALDQPIDDGIDDFDEAIKAGLEFDKAQLLRDERELLGQFVTDHPLLQHIAALRTQVTQEIDSLEQADDGDLVTVAGIVASVTRKYTKSGEPYALFRLEGLSAGVDVVAFPGVYEANPDLISAGSLDPLLVTGRIDRRGRELQIRANEVREPVFAGAPVVDGRESVVIDLTAAACTDAVLAKMAELLRSRPGPAPVKVRFHSSDGVRPLDMGEFRVDPSMLMGELTGLLGTGAARLERPT
jgi:DNA polymerase-3 subunit alpha